MGYLDGVTSAYFKTAQDGRKLFYPWGAGRSYVIASELQYKRLRRQYKAYIVVFLVLITGAVQLKEYLQGYLGLLVVAAFLAVCQMIWIRYLVRGMQPSDERLSWKDRPSWKDRMSSAAREFGSVPLWLMAISSLTMVGGAIFMLLVEPASAPPPHGLGRTVVALSGIALFGFAAAFSMRLIVLRRESHLRAIVQDAVRQELDRRE